MNGTANFSRKNVGTDKEEWIMNYTVKKADTMETLESIQKKFNAIIVKAGGQTTLDDDDED